MIADWLSEYGYLIVLLATFCEMLFLIGAVLPTSGNILLILTGYLSAVGNLNFFLCAVLAFFGTLSGSYVTYLFGRKTGRNVFKKNIWMFNEKNRNKIKDLYKKHGLKIIFAARIISFLKNFHSIGAGISKIGKREFFKYDALASFIWVLLFLSIGWIIGFFFNKSIGYQNIKEIFDKIAFFFIVGGFLFTILGVIYKKIRQKIFYKNNNL